MSAEKARKRWVNFEFKAEPDSEVYVAGTFNDWNPKEMKMKDKYGDGIYSASLRLAQGRHEYKFVVNDAWCADPNCLEWVPNSYGSLNSVINVE